MGWDGMGWRQTESLKKPKKKKKQEWPGNGINTGEVWQNRAGKNANLQAFVAKV